MADLLQETRSLEVQGLLDASIIPAASIDCLVTAAQQTFQLVEPWYQAKPASEHAVVMDIIVRIRDHTVVYFDAIDMSIRNSMEGVAFAEDALALCDFLSQSRPLDLVHFIDDMIEIAGKAHMSAQDTVDKFRSARQGLVQVTSTMSQCIDTLQKEILYAGKSKRKYDRIARVAEEAANLAMQAGPLSGLIGSGVPILGIILPIVLPLVALAAKSGQKRCQYKSEARATQELSGQEALSQLHGVNTALNGLLEHVTAFASWWSNIVGRLVTLKNNVTQPGFLRLETGRVTLIKERWVVVGNQYRGYAREISKLQDFYPEMLRREIITTTINFLPSEQAAGTAEGVPSSSQINLALTISSLAEHVKSCQISYCNLQDASVNIKPKYAARFREGLDNIRVHIIASWRDLGSYLHDVLSVGDEIRLCSLDVDSKSLKDFHQVAWIIAKVMNMAQKLSDANSTSQETVNRHKASITKLLLSDSSSRRGKVGSLVTGHFRSTSQPAFDDKSDSRSQSSGPNRKSDCRRDAESLTSLEQSLREIGSRLDDMVKFWGNRHAVFHSFVYAMDQCATNQPIEHSWVADRESIVSSITSTIMSCDTLEAVSLDSPLVKRSHGDQLIVISR
ncbi:hypothetical protein PILCRDRAFT_827125 [Piloderma croceum F 1598]|uniref:Uncharacterized protein n=1 Tax=Piloderma croceum (strain F 1598) TaxID=765440 RepID=A0A0C3BE54_PILCF|nr:hypothetical protein PILCRDRAFT_827125 [Piloderma croceum F 1598]